MKNIKNLFNIELLKKTCSETIHRFPISIGYMILIGILLFVVSHWFFSSVEEERIVLVILSAIVWFFLSVWVYLWTEWHPKRTTIQLFPIIFSILFYFWLWNSALDIENFILFLLTLAWIIAYVFFSPYLKKIVKKPTKETIFYSYFYKVSVVFLTSFILWWVLFVLWAIWITATQVLFDVGYSHIDNFYGDWAIIALSILAPFFWLAQLPQKSSFSKSDFHENTFFSFLVKYIAIPLIVIYFIILYLYTIKVLLNFSDWPKWEVTWLVIGFSIFGYLTYIYSYIFEKTEHIISIVRKAFPYVVFPQVFMLFYAIYLRVAQYDITINRYFVIVFWIWLFGLSLYYIISKNKRLIIIPASLTAITLIISIGPWSVYNLPESRQLTRLVANLTEANILQGGKITPLSSEDDISQELSKEIYWGIDYLCDFNDCEKIKNLFPKIYEIFLTEHKARFERDKENDIGINIIYSLDPQSFEYYEPNKWEIVSAITQKLKVKNYFEITQDQEFIYISLDYTKNFFPLDVNWYSKIYEIRGETPWETYAFLNIEDETITLPDEWLYDISSIIENLTALYNTPWLANPIEDPKPLEFDVDWARIYIRNINLKNPQYTWVENENPYYWAQWYILIP